VTVILSLDDVYNLAIQALTGSRTSETNAQPVAESIRAAEADGFRHAGLAHLTHYCEDARRGRVDGHAVPTWEQSAATAILVDARQGFAHAAFAVARQPLVELAQNAGIAAMALRHSYDAAMLGYFVEALAREGLVAMAFANSLSRSIAPWGGKEPIFGTNPMAFAVPRADGDPLVIDQSSSTVARMTVRQHADAQKPIPAGWALDKDGQPTTDAAAGLAGSMAPFGDYKGASLALIVDILAANMTGSSFTFEAASTADRGTAPDLGQFFIAMCPATFGNPDFGARLQSLLAAMLAQDGVRLPGSRRLANRARARREGISVDDELHKRLLNYCA